VGKRTYRGTYFPVPVSVKKVEKEVSPWVLSLGITPSGAIPDNTADTFAQLQYCFDYF
jgi:hypothetical protein